MFVFQYIKWSYMDSTLEYLKHLDWERIVFAVLLLFLAILLPKISYWVEKFIENRFSKHQAMLSSRVVFMAYFCCF